MRIYLNYIYKYPAGAEVKEPDASPPCVVFPVALPDEGGLDWADHFIAEHPGYTELSDRAILRPTVEGLGNTIISIVQCHYIIVIYS